MGAIIAEKSNNYSNALFYLGYLRGLGDFENSREMYKSYGDHYIDWLSVGDAVDFGYNRWYVLDIDKPGKRIMLLMVNTVNYYCKYSARSWEYSEMRKWLNQSYNGFLNSEYLHEYDYGLIENTLVMGSDSDVYDRIFALSVEEAEKYLPMLGSEAGMPSYWLRDKYVRTYQFHDGYYVSNDEIKHESSSGKKAIRPALWINLN